MIELNASCNRNGKRIITDLMEATQSHAVEKNCLLNLMKGIVFIINFKSDWTCKSILWFEQEVWLNRSLT